MHPVQIMVLLHYSRSNEPYPCPVDYTGVPEAHVFLVREELMLPQDHGVVTVNNYKGTGYNISEKGRILINALMTMPMPVQAWTMPK